jgi:hypothetical protein
MGIKSALSKPLASYVHKQTEKWSLRAGATQKEVFNSLITGGNKTLFGSDHGFGEIRSFKDFSNQVPIRDYEGLKPYVEKIISGEKDILWKGKPTYFAKTSGTTSGVKYIPITKDSMSNHINGAKNALLSYVHHSGKSVFLDKKMMFLSGSPVLETKGGIHFGRLSGIVNHHVPGYLKRNQKPSYDTNCIEDWEDKLDAVIAETLGQQMSLISGIPPWVQMYFDRIIEKTGKKIKDVFPDFSLFVYGGVNFDPYKAKLYESIGKHVDSVETYPASEGFIAYQDNFEEEGLLMLLNSGIFYEFIPVDKYFDENPPRLTIEEVELGVNYAVIINSNAGLWGYSIGDTVKFISRDPYRLLVTGRIKHFISAFGEHVIGNEVEKAMKATITQFPETEIIEFTVAPSINPNKGQSKHQWYISFGSLPHNMAEFSHVLDQKLCELNSYYDDLISGNILKKLEVIPLEPDAFITYMKSQGKLGGQNKVPRLSNDRKIVDILDNYRREVAS